MLRGYVVQLLLEIFPDQKQPPVFPQPSLQQEVAHSPPNATLSQVRSLSGADDDIPHRQFRYEIEVVWILRLVTVPRLLAHHDDLLVLPKINEEGTQTTTNKN